MEQIILGILAGLAVNVVEANEHYLTWLRGRNITVDAPHVPISLAVAATEFLNQLDAYALGS